MRVVLCPRPVLSTNEVNDFKSFLVLLLNLFLPSFPPRQMDVHAFLFSDMLLLCKNLNKKLDSKVKVIRQPFLIDRLIINDLSTSSSASNAGLACVYLSEFGVAAAAFTLHSPEPKIIKVSGHPSTNELGHNDLMRCIPRPFI